jgi:hypothetical protein
MMRLAWDSQIETSVIMRRSEGLKMAMSEVTHAVRGRADADDIIDEMLSLGTILRLDDGTLVDPRFETAA